jgi:1-acyl-sn-glycerol-3-phosphate acyltransferase
LLSLAGVLVWWLAPARLIEVPKLWGRIGIAALRLCCGIRVELSPQGWRPSGPALIAAQHQSAMDILIWLAVLDDPVFVLKQELKRIPVFGMLLEPAGMIPVDRSGAGPALRKMASGCQAALAAGRQIVIFPEGTRVPPGERAALHPGVVAIAKASAAPLLPAATDSGKCWGSRAFAKTPGTVRVRIFDPLPAGLSRQAILAELAKAFYEAGGAAG